MKARREVHIVKIEIPLKTWREENREINHLINSLSEDLGRIDDRIVLSDSGWD